MPARGVRLAHAGNDRVMNQLRGLLGVALLGAKVGAKPVIAGATAERDIDDRERSTLTAGRVSLR